MNTWQDAPAGTVAPSTSDVPTSVGILLVPDFSLIAFSSAIEPLRMANRLTGKTLYQWHCFSILGEAVRSSAGISVPTSGVAEPLERLDLLLVCSGVDVTDLDAQPYVSALRRFARKRIKLGALCTGSHLLARAGLLDGYRCTVHWENIAGLRESFPQVLVSSEIFEIDRDRYTCTGGAAPMDMMLSIIEKKHGWQLAKDISEQFICERIRGRNDRQRVPLKVYLGTSQPRLAEAVTLMEANIEEPMSLDELSGHVGLSRRQLERLFQKHLSCVPTRYYLELRLARSRQLLLQTNMSIVDVAFACGFVSAPHFSKCYRDHYGVPPRDDRRMKRGIDTSIVPI